MVDQNAQFLIILAARAAGVMGDSGSGPAELARVESRSLEIAEHSRKSPLGFDVFATSEPDPPSPSGDWSATEPHDTDCRTAPLSDPTTLLPALPLPSTPVLGTHPQPQHFSERRQLSLLTLHPAEFEENRRHITPDSPDTRPTRPTLPVVFPAEDDISDMANNHDKMFYGDGRVGDWNPRDYIKKIKRTLVGRANVAEADKVELFGLSLASASVAEAWFDALDPTNTATWAALEIAFKKKWPKEVLVAKSAQEMSDEMMELEMREDGMGKKIDVDGILTYGHVRWAKQMRLICEKDMAGLLIPQVHKKLPQAMRNLVISPYTDWTLFLNAVTSVSVPDLLEEIEKEKRLRSYDAALNSPTAPLRAAMAKTAISAQPSPLRAYNPATPTIRRVPAPANPNPFVSNGPIHPSNLFAPNRTPGNFRPSTPSSQVPSAERFAILQQNLPPHHPNTPAGHAAYTQQGGHLAKDRDGNPTCPNPSAIPEPERRWRNIAGFIYRTNRQTAAPVDFRYVNPVQPFYDPNTQTYFTLEYVDDGYTYGYDDEQGKGQGLSE
ncbi:hypothetical protein B0H13DRAFT_1855039 [Mycena leptocephala]|nr:hypothetical protein B0H13DRAFT_1855039 [Mycena leptocephala]